MTRASGSPQPGEETRHLGGPTPRPGDEGPLRPAPEVLAGLAERSSNIAIGKFCRVAEAAAWKWLREAGIGRGRWGASGDLADWQIALLRGDLRAVPTRTTGKEASRRGPTSGSPCRRGGPVAE